MSDTVSFADAVRTGYTFTGWYDMESGGNKVTQIETNSTGNVTLYARWKANSYTVVFDPNGGENTMSELSLTYDVAAQLVGNAFTRNGYTFAGWATEENGAVRYLDGATVINLATESGEEVTLYAIWTANSYTVKFDGNEGTVQGIGSKQVTFDAAYGTLPKAERKGYAFLGWFTAQTGGEQVTDLTFVKTSENHTLYAQWEAIEFEIVYHGTDGESATETQSFTYADEGFVSAQLQSFTRTGYTFAGWATEEGGYIVYSDKTLLSALSLPTENV